MHSPAFYFMTASSSPSFIFEREKKNIAMRIAKERASKKISFIPILDGSVLEKKKRRKRVVGWKERKSFNLGCPKMHWTAWMCQVGTTWDTPTQHQKKFAPNKKTPNTYAMDKLFGSRRTPSRGVPTPYIHTKNV